MSRVSELIYVGMLSVLLLLSPLNGMADEAKKEAPSGPPPALVALGPIENGLAEPMGEFVGTIYYANISDIAAELAGKADEVTYEEGLRIEKNHVLVRLNTDIIETSIAQTRASYDQALIELERARKDFDRMKTLYDAKSISESLYDDNLYKVRSLEKKLAGLQASRDRLEIEWRKMTIAAPFGGIVVKKTVEQGEWIPAGGTVATIADDSMVDAIIDVPETSLLHLKQGRSIEVRSHNRVYTGTYISLLPRGNIATRTFSIKVRLRNTGNLIEGMEARAFIPTGAKTSSLLVNRDAVINMFGRDVVFVMQDDKAKMIPVKVLGYDGLKASIEGAGLASGMQAVVKGNERIRDGQPLITKGQ